MSEIGIRPRFTDTLPLDEASVRERISAFIQKSGTDHECMNFHGYLVIRIPESRRKSYSPRLVLSLESENGTETRVTGTFGPNANMWSAFLYSYLFAGSTALFSGIFGFCQWKIGHTPWGLWIFWPTSLVLAALFLAARIGRKLGEKEILELLDLYETATGHGIRLQ